MTEISIDCPRCGTSAAVPDAALLVTIAGDDAAPELAGHVAWLCATCADLVTVPIGWAALLTLVTAGAALLDEEGGGESLPPHPERPVAGPAFTPDDLLELHELLASDAWFEAITTAGPTTA